MALPSGHKEIENSICEFLARNKEKTRKKHRIDQISSGICADSSVFSSHTIRFVHIAHSHSTTPRWKGEKSFLSSECKAKPYCSFSVIILYFFSLFSPVISFSIWQSHSHSCGMPVTCYLKDFLSAGRARTPTPIAGICVYRSIVIQNHVPYSICQTKRTIFFSSRCHRAYGSLLDFSLFIRWKKFN